MPYRVDYRPIQSRPNEPWAIINTDTGRIVGRSTSEANANASVRARQAGEHSKSSEGEEMKKNEEGTTSEEAASEEAASEEGKVTETDITPPVTPEEHDKVRQDHGEQPRHSSQPDSPNISSDRAVESESTPPKKKGKLDQLPTY